MDEIKSRVSKGKKGFLYNKKRSRGEDGSSSVGNKHLKYSGIGGQASEK